MYGHVICLFHSVHLILEIFYVSIQPGTSFFLTTTLHFTAGLCIIYLSVFLWMGSYIISIFPFYKAAVNILVHPCGLVRVSPWVRGLQVLC